MKYGHLSPTKTLLSKPDKPDDLLGTRTWSEGALADSMKRSILGDILRGVGQAGSGGVEVRDVDDVHWVLKKHPPRNSAPSGSKPPIQTYSGLPNAWARCVLSRVALATCIQRNSEE